MSIKHINPRGTMFLSGVRLMDHFVGIFKQRVVEGFNPFILHKTGEHFSLSKAGSDDACATNLSRIEDYKDGVAVANEFDYRVEKGDVFSHPQNITPLGPHSMIKRESFIKIAGFRTQGTIVEDINFTLRYLSDSAIRARLIRFYKKIIGE